MGDALGGQTLHGVIFSDLNTTENTSAFLTILQQCISQNTYLHNTTGLTGGSAGILGRKARCVLEFARQIC